MPNLLGVAAGTAIDRESAGRVDSRAIIQHGAAEKVARPNVPVVCAVGMILDTPSPNHRLDACPEICKLHFSAMATLPRPLDDAFQEFQFPQREAAFFYGLFLRGHSAEELRRDIEVPATVLATWDKETKREPHLRQVLEKVVSYRRHVLAIFENLICHDASSQKLQ